MNEKMQIFKQGRYYGLSENGGLVYHPMFKRRTAEALLELEQSDNPPKCWEEAAAILELRGFELPNVGGNYPL